MARRTDILVEAVPALRYYAGYLMNNTIRIDGILQREEWENRLKARKRSISTAISTSTTKKSYSI